MSVSGLSAGELTRFAQGKAYRLRTLFVSATVVGLMAWFAPSGAVQTGLGAAAGSLIVLTTVLSAISAIAQSRRKRALGVIADFVEKDSTPSLVCDKDGEILGLNPAAERILPVKPGDTLASALRTTFANPGGIVQRLSARAGFDGAAREDLVTRNGHFRLAVHDMGNAAQLWRLEPLQGDPNRAHAEGPALPMLMVSRSGTILFMNEPARAMIGQRASALDRLFTAPPQSGTCAQVSTKSGPQTVLVCELDAGAGRRAIFLLPPADAQDLQTLGSFSELPVPLLKLDSSGRITDFNQSARDLLGPKLDRGTHLSNYMIGLGRPVSDWLDETFSGRSVQPSEFLRLRDSAKETFVQVTLKRLEGGTTPTITAVLNDATELKTLEAQFVQSQKMQAIGQLAGGVAHDFNNLLTAISGHCDLLLLRHDQSDPDYSDLMQIHQNANRAAALVGQLLAFSRKQTLRTERLDLRDTLSDLMHLLNRLVGEKVSLTLSHDPVLPAIRADKRQLEQVIMNLVVNARDAMPGGGEIRVETEATTLDEPLTRDRATVPAGDYVTLRVVDQGVGIPKETLQKVFEPFFTTKRAGEGTGLGLSTAYGIIKQTGGYIFVDSVVGTGTCFTLMFPIPTGPDEVAEPATAPAKPIDTRKGAGVILLVEDEAPVRAFASRALQLSGYTVIEADSAETALDALSDPDLSIDLFVTDVVMPGKDGPTWVKEALKTRPDVRVVFVSGYTEDKLTGDNGAIPNSVFLPKPFSLNDLTETVYNQLH